MTSTEASLTESSPQTALSANDLQQTRQVTLIVGSTRFNTRVETLQESGFFAALLSGRWQSEVELDGSIFVDADAELFVHILRYLRRGILPIFFDKAKGHDYALYLALLEEARYFQIPRLEKWLSEKRYLVALQVVQSAEVLNGVESVRTRSLACVGLDVEIECFPNWETEQVYACPRGILVHKTDPSACGRQCKNASAQPPKTKLGHEQ